MRDTDVADKALSVILSDRDYVGYANQMAGGNTLAVMAVAALAAAGLLAAPADQGHGKTAGHAELPQVSNLAETPFTDLTARLAAADAGWGLASGDGPSNPDYIRWLAAQVDAFEDHASRAAPAAQSAINVTVDQEANAAYVRVAEGVVFRTAEINGSVNADYDRGAQLLGVEILDLPLAPAVPADDEATVERVAKAIHVAMIAAPESYGRWPVVDTGKLARAALAALREGQQR